jgi:hypothetical protein
MSSKEGVMRRNLLAVFAGALIMAAAAGPALGDAGAPGTTFPEQPGAHMNTGCAAIVSNPGLDAKQAQSPTAAGITLSLYIDACF